ncbi:MAG: imidazoleglycerol-phosphate dehydratase HisB [Tepidisphaeraceae bacterium]
MSRQATINRKTNETDITLSLDLDNVASNSTTGVGFFDHMLDLLARHALIGLSVSAKGDLHVDAHHTVEDVGLALGEALLRAAGDKAGINRYGHSSLPMDETLANVALDLSGRPAFVFNVSFTGPVIGTFPVELVEEFFKSVAHAARMNLHINVPYGTNNHHIAEAIFKGFARALRMAVSFDPRQQGVPSTKGTLTV